MALVEFIQECLEQNYKSLVRSVEGLTQDELSWRPDRQCNSIGFLAWHYGRVLDRWTHTRIQGIPQLWEEGWAGECNRTTADPDDAGFGFTVEQLEAFQVPPGPVLLAYAEAAKHKTMEYLGGLDDSTLENVTISNPYGGRVTLRTVFQQLLWELNQHGGQMSYLRGMQRGIEDRLHTGFALTQGRENNNVC